MTDPILQAYADRLFDLTGGTWCDFTLECVDGDLAKADQFLEWKKRVENLIHSELVRMRDDWLRRMDEP